MTEIYVKRGVIYELAKRSFQQQYMGSYLGFIWVFLQPLVFIIILYAVFSLGFRQGQSSDNIPFGIYLIVGMIAWMYFSEMLTATASAISGHSFLIKRVDFRLSILPIVKIISAIVPHIFFLIVAILISWCNGFPPSLYTLQVVYYMFSMIALLVGLGWITSSTSLFVSDVIKLVSIFSQFGFWLTPIFWKVTSVPVKYQWIFKLNPVYYVVNGYRDSLVNQIPFWHHPFSTLYYWVITLIILYVGISVFSKLRPHFAEVI